MAKSYHFSFGDSSEGIIGFCARIVANSQEEAVARLQESLPVSFDISRPLIGKNRGEDYTGALGEEYVEIYFNANAITAADIDDEEDAEEAEEEEKSDLPRTG